MEGDTLADTAYEKKYQERSEILQYSLTFSGAAAAFIVTAEEKLHFNILRPKI